jgi:hypothetical protein
VEEEVEVVDLEVEELEVLEHHFLVEQKLH